MTKHTPISDTLNARVEAPRLDGRFVVVDVDFARRLQTDHTRTFEVACADGETITGNVPNVAEDALSVLNDQGIVKVGQKVTPGTLLVGKTEPLTSPASSEEKLLRAIFGEVADIRDVSLRTPPGCFGEVLEAELSDDGSARVVVGWTRPLDVGDVLKVEGDLVVVAAIEPLDADLAWAGDSPVSVSKTAMARDTIHARSIGPYQEVPQQPTEERESFGGQRLLREQAEVLAAHAPWTLWEMFTIKSDSVRGRTLAYESIVRGENPDRLARPSTSQADDIFGAFSAPAQPTEGDVVSVVSDTISMLSAYLRALGMGVRFDASEIVPVVLGNDAIREHSHGEVSRPRLSDHQNKPEPDGLRCPKIFGPVEDYRCACGRYTRMKDRGVVCEECGVEVIPSRVRRERFGHAELAVPCRHPLSGDETEMVEVIGILPPDLRTPELDERYLAVLNVNRLVRADREAEAPKTAVAAQARRLRDALQDLSTALARTVRDLWESATFSRTVDYSGVAHLVADPSLEKGWCRVPQSMLNEMFKPHAYGILEERGYATTIKGAKRMVEQEAPEALGAVREASEGYPLLLCAGANIVSRKAIAWDEPAIAVDPHTAGLLGKQVVRVHVPLTHQAVLECSQLEDVPRSRRMTGGWLSRAIGGDIVAETRRAAVTRAVERADDPLLSSALGRPPVSPPDSALRSWQELDANRRRAIRDELEAQSAAARREAPAPERPPWVDRDIEELELAVRTRRALANANIRTIGDLCRRTEAELLKTRGFARGSLQEVKTILADLGLSLGCRDF